MNASQSFMVPIHFEKLFVTSIMDTTFTVYEFIDAARRFCDTSDRIDDGWRLFIDNENVHKSYIVKHSYLTVEQSQGTTLFKAEFIIFYNLSYGVPAFSFNIWNSSGVLLTLEEIREMAFVKIDKEDFYSVITQQEHPLFFRPYFIMHPCHTATLLEMHRYTSKNIIVTFLSLITPLLRINFPLEYGK